MNEPVLLCRDPETGFRIVRTDYTYRSKVDVRNGRYALRTYRFNNLPEYAHQYLSWANLNCCGGWTYDRNYLFREAVQQHRKLVMEENLCNSFLEGLDLDSIIESLGLDTEEVHVRLFEVEWLKHTADSRKLIVARKGCLADFFDMKEVLAVYAEHGIHFDDIEVRQMRELAHLELIDLFTQWDYANSFGSLKPEMPLPLIGLGLGYPIESTISIMEGF